MTAGEMERESKTYLLSVVSRDAHEVVEAAGEGMEMSMSNQLGKYEERETKLGERRTRLETTP